METRMVGRYSIICCILTSRCSIPHIPLPLLYTSPIPVQQSTAPTILYPTHSEPPLSPLPPLFFIAPLSPSPAAQHHPRRVQRPTGVPFTTAFHVQLFISSTAFVHGSICWKTVILACGGRAFQPIFQSATAFIRAANTITYR